MLTKEEAGERVARGAAYLDRVRPGWHEQIDIGQLALESCTRCIVGQLRGFEVLSKPMRSFDPYYGFDLTENELERDCPNDKDGARAVAFRPLQDAWIEAIADRRLSQDSATTPALAAVDPIIAAAG